MYVGGLLYMIGMPLLLGSWRGLLVLPLIVGALSVRIFIEEAALRQGLPGYGGLCCARALQANPWRVVKSAKCPLLALSGRATRPDECPLVGAKRTLILVPGSRPGPRTHR